MSPLVGTVESECQRDQKDDRARVDREFEDSRRTVHICIVQVQRRQPRSTERKG